MKKLRLLGVLLSAVMLAACSEQPAEIAENTESAATSATASAEVTTTETTAEEVPQAAAEEYVQVSPGNEFIDFEFIEDYRGTADIGDLADKAVEFFKTTEEYAESMKNISEFSEEEFSDYIVDGIIVPKFRTAYPNDYDGDGRTETFIAVDMPVHYDSNILTSFYIYADSGEKMTLLDVSGRPDENAVFLNYGRDKQIAFGGGMSPYGSVCYLYGVKDSEPVLLYSQQVGLEKRACFLIGRGFQATESFMYYDTAAREYRQIAAVQIPLEELKALDTSGSLSSVFEENGDRFSAWVVGGKYYCIKVMFEFADVYTYENGTFALMSDPPVGLNLPQSLTPCSVKDIDIDKAIAEMKPPAEPFVQVSEGSEFIDFEFIEDYQGTTDIGDLADKAVEFLKTTDFYAESMKNISEFSDKEFSDYISDGVIVPQFNIAYPNDYDGDGRTETFIMVDMPYFWSEFRPVIRNILIFADSNGEMEAIGDYSYFKPERYLVLLNYGKNKQIIFGGDGTCGADMHTILYGVKDGKAVEHFGVRGSFKKENCFLTATDYYGDDRFMYFDTSENEYRYIVGVPVSIDEMKAIDSENFFAEYYSLFEEEGFVYFELVSKNYYRVYRDLLTPAAVYKYENGKFTKIQGSGINNAARISGPKSVIDIDIDKAVAEMKPVQK